ncbi:MAG: hypothetical protein ACRDJU_15245, partial [Actinomycetota bacterium]
MAKRIGDEDPGRRQDQARRQQLQRRQQPARPQGPRHRLVDDEAIPRRVRHLIVLPGGGVAEGAEAEPREPVPGDRQEPEPSTEDYESPAISLPSSLTSVADGYPRGSAATQAAAAVAPLEVPAHPSLRLKLRVLSRTVTAPKAPTMPFIIFASVLVSLAVLGLVVLRVMVDQSSFHVDNLESRVAQQQSNLTELNYQVSVADAPGAIADRAAALGMVPATRIQPLPTPSAPAPVGG